MRKHLNRSNLAIAICTAFLPILFNACGGPNGLHALSEVGVITAASIQQKICETQLISDYAVTYHPLLKTNCNQCHSNAHGSTDVRLSFNAFMAKGQTLIDYQATHPHGNNGLNLTTEIAGLQAPWKAATDNYQKCLAANPDEQVTSGIPFNVMEKPLTGITADFKEFSWDLYTNSGDRNGQIQAMFRIEARLYSYQGAVVGFEFRNPSLQLAAMQPSVLLEGIHFTVSGKMQETATTYSTISQQVTGTVKTMLAPNLGTSFVFVTGASATTPIGFQFINLK